MFSVLEHKEGAERLEKVTNGASESAAIHTLLYDNRHKTFDQVAEDHNLSLS